MLKQRILSAVVAIPLLILVFKVGGVLFLTLNLLVVLLGMNEYFKLVNSKGIKSNKFLGILIGLILVLLAYLNNNSLQYIYGLLSLSLIIIMLKQALISLDRSAIVSTAVMIFGVIYVAGLFSHLILLYNFEVKGQAVGKIIVWLPIIATWITDTGAYFTGMNLGKNALAPNISPNKTIEGALGGLVASIIVTIMMSNHLGFGYIHGVILGIIISVVAQLGDLCESAFKRDAQIKDSGDVIPGHGGILDRIDSLLFALPIVYYYVKFIVF